MQKSKTTQRNKALIMVFSLFSVLVVGLVATIIALAASTQTVGSDLSIVYVASEIAGSVSATYQVGSNAPQNMTDGSGNTTISFDSSTPSTLSLLSPNTSITLNSTDDVILTYTFTNAGEIYYATVSYADTDSNSPSENLAFYYKAENGEYDTESSVVTVPRLGSATYTVKISIDKLYLNASLKGQITWALTKDKPIEPDIKNSQTKTAIYLANNTGSTLTTETVDFVVNEATNQFKIVAPTPTVSSSSANGYTNGVFSERTTTATGKVSSIDDLKNSSGAEFYYFCTNQAVVGTTSFVDPGTVYWPSTSGNSLENWYDIPSSKVALYACFMVPDWKNGGGISTSSDSGEATNNGRENVSPFYPVSGDKSYLSSSTGSKFAKFPTIISNADTEFSGWTYLLDTSSKCFVIPQSMKTININCNGKSITSATKLYLPSSLTTIGGNVFYGCSDLTSVYFADTTSTWTVNGTVVSVDDPEQNAIYLKTTYKGYTWTKNSK